MIDQISDNMDKATDHLNDVRQTDRPPASAHMAPHPITCIHTSPPHSIHSHITYMQTSPPHNMHLYISSPQHTNSTLLLLPITYIHCPPPHVSMPSRPLAQMLFAHVRMFACTCVGAPACAGEREIEGHAETSRRSHQHYCQACSAHFALRHRRLCL